MGKKDNEESPAQITMQQNNEKSTELKNNKDYDSIDNDKNEEKTAESIMSNDDQQKEDLMEDDKNEDDQLIGDNPVIVEMDENDEHNKNVNEYQSVSLVDDDDV